MAGEEKLLAALRPPPANYAEAWAERVLGVLAAVAIPLTTGSMREMV
jgi:hypothetical protein